MGKHIENANCNESLTGKSTMSRCIPYWKWGIDGQSCQFTEDKGLYPCFGKKTQPKFKLWIKTMKNYKIPGILDCHCGTLRCTVVVLFLCGKHVGHASMRTEPDLHDYLAWFHTKSASEKNPMVSEMKKTRFTQLMVWVRFFWRSSMTSFHNFLQWSQTSNVSWPKSWKFQLFWAFSPVFSGKHHNRLEWRVTSGPSPPTMAWHRGIGRKSSKDGDLNRSPEKSQPFQNHSISSVLKEKL